MSGEPCFADTRVPVRALLDYIEGGDTIDEFLEQYPTVTRKQAIAFLEPTENHLAFRPADTGTITFLYRLQTLPFFVRIPAST